MLKLLRSVDVNTNENRKLKDALDEAIVKCSNLSSKEKKIQCLLD